MSMLKDKRRARNIPRSCIWISFNVTESKFLQDNRVTDHRLKMNFELTSFLDGDIETAVQVKHLLAGSLLIAKI